jgi:hypothetical protein
MTLTIFLTSTLVATLTLASKFQYVNAEAINEDHYDWSPPWGDWKHYHNYTEIVNTLLYLNDCYPNIVDVFSIGKSWLGKDIYCIRLTNEASANAKPQVFFVGYHHAQERISAELPLYFTFEAASQYGVDASITYLLDHCEMYFVVALNVDGFEVVKRNEWQRKNAHPFDEDGDGLLDEDPPDDEDGNGYVEWLGTGESCFIEGLNDDDDHLLNEDWIGGVDLNRNYDYQWNAACSSGSSDPNSEAYRGPTPFSEPETQAIRDLVLQHNFKYALSFHSGSECIIYPWGYTTIPTIHDPVFKEIAGNLSLLTGARAVQGAVGLYTTSGVWDDWMYGDRGIFALTCEIYSDPSKFEWAPGSDPGSWRLRGVTQFYNPVPNDIEKVIQRWLPVFHYISNRAIVKDVEFAQVVTTLTLEVPFATQGKSMILKAYLKDAYGGSVKDVNVQFQILGWPSWHEIGSGSTDHNGVASICYTPSRIGRFKLRAVFNRTIIYSVAISEITILNVSADYTTYQTLGYLSLAIGIAVGCPEAYTSYRKKKRNVKIREEEARLFQIRWNTIHQIWEQEQMNRRQL